MKFGFEPSVYISYKSLGKYNKEYLDILTHLSNRLLIMKISKKYLLFGTEIKFDFDDKKYYYYDNNNNIGIIGFIGNSKDFWYPPFSSYNDYFLKIPIQNKKYKEVLEEINKYYRYYVTNDKIKDDFSVLVYALSVLGSEWDYKDKKIYLKELIEKILEILNKNIYKELGEIYKVVLNEN